MCDVWCVMSDDSDFIADDKKQSTDIQRDKEEEGENKKSKGDKVPKTVSYF